MKRKILDFSVMKEEISQNNVLEMAELIAFMELRFQIGYQGSRVQKMYADLYADIKHKSELGYMLSDSSLRLNCNVRTNGWRVRLLREIKIIPFHRNLEFYIESTNVPKPYKIYWKVRNMGEEAYKRNQIRGQIVKGEDTKKEKSSFNGPHYVECYLIKNGICVARDIITVNIQAGAIDGLEVV